MTSQPYELKLRQTKPSDVASTSSAPVSSAEEQPERTKTRTTTTNKRSEGRAGEDEACKFLIGLGYKIVKRNFVYGRVGEIDIVAQDGDTLVFIEVKARTNYKYGLPEESIDRRKQAQLKRVAGMYFYVNKLQDVSCRFDVIAVDLFDGAPTIRHHIAAFY